MCMICCWCCWCSSHHHHHHLHGYHYDLIFVNFLWRSSPISGLGRLIVELSRSHTVIHVHMHTPGRISLNEWPNCRRGHYLHNTKQTQQTKIPAPSGIRTRDPSNQVASYLRLLPTESVPYYFQTLPRQDYHTFFYIAGHSISYTTSDTGHSLMLLSRYLLQLLIYVNWWKFHFNIQQFCVILNLQPLLIILTDSGDVFRFLEVPFPYFNSTFHYCT
jgi:hypothetical protein